MFFYQKLFGESSRPEIVRQKNRDRRFREIAEKPDIIYCPSEISSSRNFAFFLQFCQVARHFDPAVTSIDPFRKKNLFRNRIELSPGRRITILIAVMAKRLEHFQFFFFKMSPYHFEMMPDLTFYLKKKNCYGQTLPAIRTKPKTNTRVSLCLTNFLYDNCFLEKFAYSYCKRTTGKHIFLLKCCH